MTDKRTQRCARCEKPFSPKLGADLFPRCYARLRRMGVVR